MLKPSLTPKYLDQALFQANETHSLRDASLRLAEQTHDR
jgi:hypothetical protein